jgi:hypothetical protein
MEISWSINTKSTLKCGGMISAILGEIVLGVNNFGGQFPFFGGLN